MNDSRAPSAAPRKPALHLLLPGDPATRTGGYVYARRIGEALAAAGREVRVHRLPAAFPHPSGDDLAYASQALDALQDGALALVDGLACGAMPEVVMRHAGRQVQVYARPEANETVAVAGVHLVSGLYVAENAPRHQSHFSQLC